MTEGAPTPEARRKRATIWEVARLAGVSHQTVSRYFKGDSGMKPATREKIGEAVAELDYQPSLIARSMRTQRSNRIAIVLPEMTSFVPAPILKGASIAAHEAGYSTDVMGLEGDEKRRAEGVISLLRTQQVDAVLSFTPLGDLAERADPSRPVMVYGEYDDHMRSQGALADGQPAAEIVRYLADLGHRRFLHVAGADDWASARNRRTVYEETVADLGLESYGVVRGDWSVRSGYEAARDLPANSGVTAVLAANDYVAMGVVRGFQDRGIDVPGEVSVFGWDDEQFTEYFRPTLSTVHNDREALGREAMRALLGRIRGDDVTAPVAPSLFRLIPRGSSGPAPGPRA
ncbi:LacI family DNA-binding transcriptional regulator [Streptomyces zhihengii]